jgi:hypothetical protein
LPLQTFRGTRRGDASGKNCFRLDSIHILLYAYAAELILFSYSAVCCTRTHALLNSYSAYSSVLILCTHTLYYYSLLLLLLLLLLSTTTLYYYYYYYHHYYHHYCHHYHHYHHCHHCHHYHPHYYFCVDRLGREDSGKLQPIVRVPIVRVAGARAARVRLL